MIVLAMLMASEKNTSRRAEQLDGAGLAAEIKREVAADIVQFWQTNKRRPCLAAVRVGDDPASEVYVRNKIRACEEVGIASEHHALSATTTEADLLELVRSLNERAEMDGVLRQ